MIEESIFVENGVHEVYREIYGDPIYDIYEDDLLLIDRVDFVFRSDAFRKVRANLVQDYICVELFCANIGRYSTSAKFVQILDYEQNPLCANIGRKSSSAEAVQNPGYADSMFYQPGKLKKTLLKIRGRIFLGRRDLMQRVFKIIINYLYTDEAEASIKGDKTRDLLILRIPR